MSKSIHMFPVYVPGNVPNVHRYYNIYLYNKSDLTRAYRTYYVYYGGEKAES